MKAMSAKSLATGFAITAAAMIVASGASLAQTASATYQFDNTLAADQGGVPALTPTDPLASNGYITDTVFGQTRQVYQTIGSASPLSEAGLSLDTSGLLTANSVYSVNLIASITNSNGTGWRRLIDVQNRQSDDGFYVNPSSVLDVYPNAPVGTTVVTPNAYHDITLVNNAGTVAAYLDGNLEFTDFTNVMDVNNPGNLVNFYLDNVAGGGQGEYTNANTALISLYNSALTPTQVAAIDQVFPTNSAVPESSTLTLTLLGLGSIIVASRRKQILDSRK